MTCVIAFSSYSSEWISCFLLNRWQSANNCDQVLDRSDMINNQMLKWLCDCLGWLNDMCDTFWYVMRHHASGGAQNCTATAGHMFSFPPEASLDFWNTKAQNFLGTMKWITGSPTIAFLWGTRSFNNNSPKVNILWLIISQSENT